MRMTILHTLKYGITEVIGAILFCLLLVVYLPLYILGFFTIQKNLLVLRLSRILRFRYTNSKLGLISRRSRVTDVSQVSTNEEIDFQDNRSLAYVTRMTLCTPRELVRTILRQQKIGLISDEQLAFTILSTVYAHSVTWDDERELFRLHMDGFDDFFLFEGFFWDARHVLVSRDGKKIIIQMQDGSEVSNDFNVYPKHDYDLAKLHVQVCLSYFAPGLSHNHVHFVFPSAICVSSKNILDKNGVLYKLLSPHFRFTERINYQALRVGKATNNKRSFLDRLFFLWQPFPVTKEQFIEGVARKCKQYYQEKKGFAYRGDVTKGEPMSNGHAHGSDSDSSDGMTTSSENRHHPIFPPEYVTNKGLQQIPYLEFLREYYLVIRKFVETIVPYINKEEWKELKEAVAVHVPKFDKVNIVDGITTFIHQVGVVHFCDHNSYTRYFAYAYGSMAIRTPYEKFQDTEHWDSVAAGLGLSVAAIQNDPLLLIRQRDVMRTRCFLNIFVDFIPSPKCNLRLLQTDYNFAEKGPQEAVQEFKSQLRSLDGNLKSKPAIMRTPPQNGELRPEGLRIVPLPDIVRSVCF